MSNYTDLLFIQSGATICSGPVMQLFPYLCINVICTIKVALDSILLHHLTSISFIDKKAFLFLHHRVSS